MEIFPPSPCKILHVQLQHSRAPRGLAEGRHCDRVRAWLRAATVSRVIAVQSKSPFLFPRSFRHEAIHLCAELLRLALQSQIGRRALLSHPQEDRNAAHAHATASSE